MAHDDEQESDEAAPVKIELFATAESASDIADALRHAAKQIEEGFTAGDLRNQAVHLGSWDIKPADEDE